MLQNVENISFQRALELDIIYKCNMNCAQCNRALGVLPSQETMTVEQVSRALEESTQMQQPYFNIRILGGEPTLHPDLSEILEELNCYRSRVPESTITLWSNGYGAKVQRVLNTLPSWIQTRISPKQPVVEGTNFEKFLAAPLDFTEFHDSDYWNGCGQIAPGKCGVGVNLYGVYVCPVAGAIDRVLGLNIGLKKLSDVTEQRFIEQCKSLCCFCGHFLYDRGVKPNIDTMSLTWLKLQKEYKRRKPTLTVY